MDPAGLLVESSLLPGEPQGFGAGAAVLRLLHQAVDWTCVEVGEQLATEIGDEFARTWGVASTVVDVFHACWEPTAEFDHPLVRQLTPQAALELPQVSSDLLPDRRLAAAAAERGRLFGAIERGVLVGQGGSLAACASFADVGVHVSPDRRGDGIATACASRTCIALQSEGLVPVWSTSAENAASLAIAGKLGFVEVDRLRYLIRSPSDG